MPKAILELEMPESCGQCPCSRFSYNIGICNVILEFCPEEGRHKYCPLKLADEHCRKAEWLNGKCKGFQVSRWNYDPIPKCKNCKDFEEYKEVEKE